MGPGHLSSADVRNVEIQALSKLVVNLPGLGCVAHDIDLDDLVAHSLLGCDGQLCPSEVGILQFVLNSHEVMILFKLRIDQELP